jgi:hypothetical protein
MDSALMFAAYQAEQDKLRQQPEQENNLVDALGKAALAAGVATAGIVGGRRFFAGRGAAPTPVRNTSATTDLSNINVNNLRRASGRPPVNVTETVVPSRPAPRPVPQTTIERLGDVNEITRQARSERPQGIKFVDLSDEVRTSVDPWSGKETILTPFGSPTIPPVRTTETTTRGTRLLSPAAPDAADRLLNDPDLLRRVNKEYNVGQEAKELAIDNLLSSNRSEQAKQAARRRQVLAATGDDIISTLRSEANQLPSVSERLRSVGAGLSGAPEELGGEGIKIYSTKFNRDLDFSSPITQQLLTSANVTQNEAINYWTQKITSSTTKAAQTAEAAAQSDFGPQTFLKQKGYIDTESMTEQHVAARPQHIEQVEDALSSGAHQMEGRTKHRLQQNEDLDLGQVEIMEEMADAQYRNFVNQAEPSQMMGLEPDIHVEQVASRLPDGLPVDQAEGALSFAQKRMQEIRGVQEAQGYRGLSTEKQMLQGEQGTRIKQASELYAATGDPNVLSLISETPSLPISVQPKAQQLITTQSLEGDAPSELSTSSLYSPFKKRELNVNKQEDVDMRMTNRLSGLGATRETIPKIIINPEYAALEEQTNMAMYGMKQGNPTAANIYYQNRQKFREGKVPPREIINPEYLTLSQQMSEAESVRREARDIIESKKSNVAQFPSVYRVADLQEGVRPFYEQTLEGEIIPETLELRKGRPSRPAGTVEKPASGSSMRGLRGVEREFASTETMESNPIRWDPSLHSPAQRTPEGFVYTEEAMRKPSEPVYTRGEIRNEIAMSDEPIGYEEAVRRLGSQPATEVGRRSIDVSEDIRKIKNSNSPEKAQRLVNVYLQQLKGG